MPFVKIKHKSLYCPLSKMAHLTNRFPGFCDGCDFAWIPHPFSYHAFDHPVPRWHIIQGEWKGWGTEIRMIEPGIN